MPTTRASVAFTGSGCARAPRRRSLRTAGMLALIATACALAFGCGVEGEKPESPSAPAAPGASEAKPAASVAQRSRVTIDNAMAGWVPTGVRAAAGEEIALIGTGTVEIAGVGFEPRHVMWYRVGEEGDAERFAANALVFTAASGGDVAKPICSNKPWFDGVPMNAATSRTPGRVRTWDAIRIKTTESW